MTTSPVVGRGPDESDDLAQLTRRTYELLREAATTLDRARLRRIQRDLVRLHRASERSWTVRRPAASSWTATPDAAARRTS